uniref:Heme A synthase, cytochrome oxidase biogenesis protein Cox15-CtaA n=1 Tax=uncultured Thiotrichaceae bacterium TaxID=298394 RepID=A0A6S6U9J8_9GAMM|nr:MAG: Heme A synthase, cytochrome oxidase biogenesis protein Cox15-CtaA [uncultured Thiotrichaceae bacterium]
MSKFYSNLLVFTLLLALVVIVLGAYTRLADAGLGCPDWPGCYGHLTVPETIEGTGFERPLEPAKAWAEMVHRYVAGTLGVVILLVFLLALFVRELRERQGVALPFILLCTVIFQALLGMWTVTKLLSPVIVTAHLIGGFTTLALIWLLWLRSKHQSHSSTMSMRRFHRFKGLRVWAGGALLVVIIQIILGGWTSTNYAAIACGPTYPTCHGSLWPEADFKQGFSLENQMQEGQDYEFGILESPARTAIHMTHRAGALVVLLIVGLLGLRLVFAGKALAFVQTTANVTLVLLFTQFTLGILNVVLALPLSIATGHNLVAALLLLAVITLNYKLSVDR